MTPETRHRLSTAMLLIAVAFLLIIYFDTCNDKKQAQNVLKFTQDSLHTTINKLGQQTAENEALQATYGDFKIANDYRFKELQSFVDKHTTSAELIKIQTTDKGTTATAATPHDTIFKNDTCFIFPEYTTSWCDSFSQGTIRANRDSIFHDFTTNNILKVKQEIKGCWFCKKSINTSVTNENPHTRTTQLQSYKAIEKHNSAINNTTIGFVGGLILGFLIFK